MDIGCLFSKFRQKLELPEIPIFVGALHANMHTLSCSVCSLIRRGSPLSLIAVKARLHRYRAWLVCWRTV